jgi:hypothetical protein
MRNYRLIRLNSLDLTVRCYTIAKNNSVKTVGKFLDLIEDIELNGRRKYSHRFSQHRIKAELLEATADYLNR